MIFWTEKKNAANTWRAAQLRLFDLEEERQAWLRVGRQAVLDWDFLDKALTSCSNTQGVILCYFKLFCVILFYS